MKKIHNCLVVFLTMLMIAAWGGCAHKQLNTVVLRPAKINLAGYKRVIIGRFDGDGSVPLRAQILNAVFSSQKYEVLDRASLSSAVTELELQQAGLGNNDTNVEIVRADALIAGTVEQRCNQTVESGQFQRTNAQGYTYTVTQYRRCAQATVNFYARESDLRTLKVLVTDNLSANEYRSSEWYDNVPPQFDERSLYESCYPTIVRNFMKNIAPFRESVSVDMYKSSHYPEVKNGIQLFAAGQYQNAAQIFETALNSARTNPKVKPKELSGILCDLGVAKEYQSDFEGAKACYTDAITAYPKRETYTHAISRCRMREKDAVRLKEQNVDVNK